MPLEFTVVINVRQRFGDNENVDKELEVGAPLVGLQKDYEFACPNVDKSQTAVLLFQTMGVSHDKNILQVNGQPVFGGIPGGGVDRAVISEPGLSEHGSPRIIDLSRAVWNANVLLITPGVLRENNVLHIESVPNDDGDPDDFIIDNAVVLYKTRVFNQPGGVFNG